MRAWARPLEALLAAGASLPRPALAGLTRRLPLPPGLPVVAVGGATFGGSGKTPLALACARALANAGARVALVGHAYRARPGRPRVVRPGSDLLEEVGDEALACAAALQGRESQAEVVVAPRRSEATAFAARRAEVLVLDGVLQTAPRRAALSLLALPTFPTAGEPSHRIRRICDLVVPIADEAPVLTGPHARIVSRGAWHGSALVPWEQIATARVGLFTALAGPGRVLRFLARRGVFPVRRVETPDHGPRSARARASMYEALRSTNAAAVDVWLASAKCAPHAAFFIPDFYTIDYALELPPLLLAALTAALAGNNLEGHC